MWRKSNTQFGFLAVMGAIVYAVIGLDFLSTNRLTEGALSYLILVLFMTLALLFFCPHWFLTVADDE